MLHVLYLQAREASPSAGPLAARSGRMLRPAGMYTGHPPAPAAPPHRLWQSCNRGPARRFMQCVYISWLDKQVLKPASLCKGGLPRPLAPPHLTQHTCYIRQDGKASDGKKEVT
eukprot:1156780-Pelagomonas_calceolata.AAC.8